MSKDYTYKIGLKKRFRLNSLISSVYSITKFPLSLHIGLSALMGYTIVKGMVDIKGFFVFFSILLLACGGAALNNIQDKEYDKLFTRTRNRPIPNGFISEGTALIIAISFIISGLFVLYNQSKNFSILLLGVLSIVIYNFVYTVLKKRSSLGVIPGAICGMLPPLIGWFSAGGDFYNVKIISVMLVFGVWQFPHYFMVLLQNREEFSRLKALVNYYPHSVFKAVIIIWVITYFSVVLTLPLVGILDSSTGYIFLIFYYLIALPFIVYSLIKDNYRNSFIWLNLSLLILMFSIMIESIHKVA